MKEHFDIPLSVFVTSLLLPERFRPMEFNLEISHSPSFALLEDFPNGVFLHTVLFWNLRRQKGDMSHILGTIPLQGEIFANMCNGKRRWKLTASLRPLRVGAFNMRASNTSSVSRLTYRRTENKEFSIKTLCDCDLYHKIDMFPGFCISKWIFHTSLLLVSAGLFAQWGAALVATIFVAVDTFQRCPVAFLLADRGHLDNNKQIKSRLLKCRLVSCLLRVRTLMITRITTLSKWYLEH